MKNKALILVLIGLFNSYLFLGQSCSEPRGFRVTQVTGTTVSLSWDQMTDNPYSWQIEYGLHGFTQGIDAIDTIEVVYNGGVVTDTHFALIQDLQSNTTYDFYIRTRCQTVKGFIYSNWSNVVIATTVEESNGVTCEIPVIESVSATDNSITISWIDTNGSIQGWDIEYGRSGFVVGDGITDFVDYSNGSTYTTPTNLTPDTLYDFYIKAKCTDTNYSEYSPAFQVTTTNNGSVNCQVTEPTNLHVGYETTYSVYVYWDYPYDISQYSANDGSGTLFEVVCVREGFPPEPPYIAHEETILNGITLTGLSPSQSHSFYVRAICKNKDGDVFQVGEWVGPISGTTLSVFSTPEFSGNTDIDCGGSFNPDRLQEYIISGWVKENHTALVPHTFDFPEETLKAMYNYLIKKVQEGEAIPNGYDVFAITENNINFGDLLPYINTYNPKIWHFCHDAEAQTIRFTYKRPLNTFQQNGNIDSFDSFGCFEESEDCCYNEINYSILGTTATIDDVVITDISMSTNTQTNPFIDVEINEHSHSDSACYYLNGDIDIEASIQSQTYEKSAIHVAFMYGDVVDTIGMFYPSGSIINGWQRIEGYFALPPNQNIDFLTIELINTGSEINYFDDIRIFPFNGNMKSFVYDAKTKKLMSELDENNYATFYEYDKEGGLVRIKKETEKGIFTIQETRSKNAKH